MFKITTGITYSPAWLLASVLSTSHVATQSHDNTTRYLLQEETKQFTQGHRGCELGPKPGIQVPKAFSSPRKQELQEWSTPRSLVRDL